MLLRPLRYFHFATAVVVHEEGRRHVGIGLQDVSQRPPISFVRGYNSLDPDGVLTPAPTCESHDASLAEVVISLVQAETVADVLHFTLLGAIGA